MDAAYISLKKTAFFLALATLTPAAAFAQQPTFVLNSGSNITSITLISNQSTPVTVASSMTPTTEITFSAHTVYSSGDLPWLCIANTFAGCDSTTAATPTTFNVLVGQSAADLSIGTH